MKYIVKLISLIRNNLYILGVLLLNSCVSFRGINHLENQVYLTEENLGLINGTYKHNDKERPAPLEHFWGSFYRTKEFDSVYELVSKEKEPYFIIVKVINKNRLNVEVKVKNVVLKNYTIRGKVKNGYFEQNRKTILMPAILFNSYCSSKFRIGYLKDGDLITDLKRVEFGTYYFIHPFTNNEEYNNLIEERIE